MSTMISYGKLVSESGRNVKLFVILKAFCDIKKNLNVSHFFKLKVSFTVNEELADPNSYKN